MPMTRGMWCLRCSSSAATPRSAVPASLCCRAAMRPCMSTSTTTLLVGCFALASGLAANHKNRHTASKYMCTVGTSYQTKCPGAAGGRPGQLAVCLPRAAAHRGRCPGGSAAKPLSNAQCCVHRGSMGVLHSHPLRHGPSCPCTSPRLQDTPPLRWVHDHVEWSTGWASGQNGQAAWLPQLDRKGGACQRASPASTALFITHPAGARRGGPHAVQGAVAADGGGRGAEGQHRGPGALQGEQPAHTLVSHSTYAAHSVPDNKTVLKRFQH
jgi:hypothetical protein